MSFSQAAVSGKAYFAGVTARRASNADEAVEKALAGEVLPLHADSFTALLDRVQVWLTVLEVAGRPITAPIDGVIRGLVRDGT